MASGNKAPLVEASKRIRDRRSNIGKATLADLITCVDYLVHEAQQAGLSEAALLLGMTAISLRESFSDLNGQSHQPEEA